MKTIDLHLEEDQIKLLDIINLINKNKSSKDIPGKN